jgi:hypothetical protein
MASMRMSKVLLAVLVVGGCSNKEPAKDSSKQGVAAQPKPADDAKTKESLAADLKLWVEKTYTSEPHKLVDIAGRETPVKCDLKSSSQDPVPGESTPIGLVEATGQLGDRPLTAQAAFQKGPNGWECRHDDPKEETKWNAINCEILDVYCSRNPPPPKLTSMWEYKERADKMRGTTAKFATVTSLNEFPISFPTSGTTKLEMVLRHDGKTQDILLRATNGALDPCVPQCTIAAKFGDGAVAEFTANPTDGVPGSAIFIANTTRWLKLMKTTKLAVVEVTLFEGGRRQFEFAVVGLEWPR